MRDGVALSVSLVTDDGATFAKPRPDAAGFCPERLARLERHLRASVGRGDAAGISAVIVRGGALAFASCIGVRDVATRQPLRADTIFRIYSMSKPIVSVAAMILLERGGFLLSDPVRAYLPEVAKMRVFTQGSETVGQQPEMTIADLMTHTAGLTYAGNENHPVDRRWAEAKLFRKGETIQDAVARMASLPLKFQPGTQFEYSIAHDVLGALIERVSGQKLGAFLASDIFEPLDMADTAFEVPAEKLSRFATLYGPGDDGQLKVLDEGSPRSRWIAPHKFEAGGEGLVSTVPDYLRFCSMLRGQGELAGTRVLSRKSVALMTANRLTEAQRTGFWMKGYGYGLGFGVLLDPAANANLGSPGEYTWAGSASTFFWIDPMEDIIALLFLQLEPSSHLTIARQFKALMYQALI